MPTGIELDSVNCIPNASFDLTTLTGAFQVMNGANGTSDDIKQLVIYNGGAVGVDISYDGVTKHDFWPAGATIIFDFQTNHAMNPNSAGGTKYLRKGQKIWGRTSTTSAQLQMSGYR